MIDGDRRWSITWHCCATFRKTRGERPFAIDAIVILPDHLHAIMTLPPGDADFSGRWRRIKSVFTRSVVAAGVPVSRNDRGEYALGKGVFGSTPLATKRISNAALTTSISIFNPVKHRLVTSPNAWPFSSLHRYVRAGVLPSDWGGDGRTTDANFGERGD